VNSKIYVGTVSHTRTWPTVHSFTYPLYTYAFDLAELPALAGTASLFGYNRLKPVSLYDKDYFDSRPEPLINKVRHFLAKHVADADDVTRIDLVTGARYFNYIFNPVSFFYCYAAGGTIKYILAYVNNTFSETHIYLLKNPLSRQNSSFTRFQVDKNFHVSPFFDRDGTYDFHFAPLGDKLDIHIRLVKSGKTVFNARLAGVAQPFTTKKLLQTIGRYPFSALLTMPRIVWEAGKLYFHRRLSVYKKPVASSEFTIRRPSITYTQKVAMKLVFAVARHIKYGSLEIVLPDRSNVFFGDKTAKPHHRIYVHDYAFFTRLVTGNDVGLGESFMAEEWDTDDLPGLLAMLFQNTMMFENSRFTMTTYLKRIFHRWLYRQPKNNVSGSRKNIQAHYDLSNQMYQLFLDETMTYSAAYFTSPDEPLADAQRNKLQRIIKKARIEAHHHVLEIGSGWGSFAIEAVRQTGCRVTTVTISDAQYKLAKERIAEAGLEDKIEIRLCDYRKLTGQYDRIVSIEMIEAVGHEYLPQYFKTVDRLLKQDGLFVLQSITIPDQEYERYRHDTDWIRKHIFPGGHLPSVEKISSIITEHTNFVIDHLENIGLHYAVTLARWREQFLQNESAIRALGFDQVFCRKWLFYFAYCEAGFGLNHLGDIQVVLTRPRNPSLALW
jgi:cyclopropane-fatty-acyl-phospholipid synthase